MTFLGGGVVFIGNLLIADVQVQGKSVRVVAGWGGGGSPYPFCTITGSMILGYINYTASHPYNLAYADAPFMEVT